MVKIYQWFKTMPVQRKLLVMLTSVIVLGLGMFSGTHAWQSLGQSALNMGGNSIAEKEVYLLKLERDETGTGIPTPIAGATFYLYKVGEIEDQQIGGLYTTNEDGKIPVSLTPGNYYFEEVTPSLGYTFDLDDKENPIKRYPFTVTQTSPEDQAIVTAYNVREMAPLVIEKTVVNEDGTPINATQQAQDFEFVVTFDDENSYYYQVNGSEPKLLASGDTLILKHNQQAIFQALPLGLHYIVTEKSLPNYESSATNSSGNITSEETVASFINKYVPSDLEVGQLEISKEVINGDETELTQEQKEHDFSFSIYLGEDQAIEYDYQTTTGRTGTISSGDTFSLKHDETMTVSNLPLGLAYQVTEQIVEGYTSSPVDYKGTILSQKTVSLPFINQFDTVLEQTGSLRFTKQVVAAEINKDQAFEFILTFSDDGTYEYQLNDGEKRVHQSGETLLLKHGDDVFFPEIPAGVSYELIEQAQNGYYSELEKVEGTIISNETIAITFHNYQLEHANLSIKKVGQGAGFDKKKEFHFNVWINGALLPEKVMLKAGETSQPIPLRVGDTWLVVEENQWEEGYSQTSLVNGSGVVTKPNQTVEVIQTNTYVKPQMVQLTGKKTWSIPQEQSIDLPKSITVNLKNGDQTVATAEVTGPDWAYQFEVPKYDQEGKEINYTIEEVPVDGFKPIYNEGTLDIENIHLTPVTKTPLKVIKKLAGDKPEVTEIFEFRLSPGNDVLEINGAGEGTFKPITFEKVGTYVYTITERNKGTLGFTYDTAIYTWTVVVEEKDNQLVIVSEKIEKNEQDYLAEELVFENHFDQGKLIHEKIDIKGIKTWNYGTQPISERPKAITVMLYANDELAYQKEVTAADEWSYSFSVNKYDKNGREITYSVVEAPLENYEVTRDGFNLTNTYTGTATQGTGPTDSGSKTPVEGTKIPSYLPQTGEELAKVLIAVGTVLVIAVVIYVFARKKKIY